MALSDAADWIYGRNSKGSLNSPGWVNRIIFCSSTSTRTGCRYLYRIIRGLSSLTPATDLEICFRRQTRDADSGMAFVADVQADEERGDLLEDAGVLQFAAVDGADAG